MAAGGRQRVFIRAALASSACSTPCLKAARPGRPGGLHPLLAVAVPVGRRGLLAALWLLVAPWGGQKPLGAALLAEGLLHVGMAAGTIKIIRNQVPDSRDREEVFSCDGPKRW